MLCLNEDDYAFAFGEFGAPSVIEFARSQDARYGAGAWIAEQKWADKMNALAYTSMCPEHGEQEVTDWYSTKGADPHQIEILACGHHTIGFSKDEIYIVEGGRVRA